MVIDMPQYSMQRGKIFSDRKTVLLNKMMHPETATERILKYEE